MLDTNFSKKLMCVYIYTWAYEMPRECKRNKKPDAFPYPALDIETSFFPQPFF